MGKQSLLGQCRHFKCAADARVRNIGQACIPNYPSFATVSTARKWGTLPASVPLLHQCAYCKSEGHTKLDCPALAKQARASRRLAKVTSLRGLKESGESTVSSTAVSTALTWASSKEKKLREIAALEAQLAAGEPLDTMQQKKADSKIAALEARLAAGEALNAIEEKKIRSKPEIQGCEVMRNLRLGYACASQKPDGEKVRAYACQRRALNHMA